ncbi:hypothetical protein RND71_034051 [Anisodus tanguticus]|uniref:Zinc finger PMZ-type domain-containing protein n=1 Tax=Anisodus tanguticus TaxID=243964 RepID=A0AAE1RBD2_9SOLA|nr:hypothetical protein RND71_034051 [Anisodus tanguticus]
MKVVHKWVIDYSPTSLEIYKDFVVIVENYEVHFNGDDGYEVSEGTDTHIVDLMSKKCIGRTWDLSGIPCTHVIRAYKHRNNDPIVEGAIHPYYNKATYLSGSSRSSTTMLESEDNFPSSSNTTTVLEPDSSLRSRSFSEANTRILERMKQPLATPTRRISFVSDSTGMSQPTNTPYQPPNKVVVTGNKLEGDKREDEDNEWEWEVSNMMKTYD